MPLLGAHQAESSYHLLSCTLSATLKIKVSLISGVADKKQMVRTAHRQQSGSILEQSQFDDAQQKATESWMGHNFFCVLLAERSRARVLDRVMLLFRTLSHFYRHADIFACSTGEL
jgi:hypothetical protein